MKHNVTISSSIIPEGEIEEQVQIADPSIVFERRRLRGVRTVDATVLVAVVSNIGVLISCLLTFAMRRSVSEITIVGKSGWSVKVPADTKPSEIGNYIGAAKEGEIDSVEI